MMNQRAFLAVLVWCLLTGCSSAVTPYAKSIGVKDVKEVDGMLKSYIFGVATFVRHGVLTYREGEVELALETYHLTAENKSQAYKYGYLGGLYKNYPEAQNRRRLCRAVDFAPDGYPSDLECKGVKLSSFVGAGGSWKKDQIGSQEPAMPQQRTLQKSQTGALPPVLPSPPAASENTSSTYTVFGPDGKMQTCTTYSTSRTVVCY